MDAVRIGRFLDFSGNFSRSGAVQRLHRRRQLRRIPCLLYEAGVYRCLWHRRADRLFRGLRPDAPADCIQKVQRRGAVIAEAVTGQIDVEAA